MHTSELDCWGVVCGVLGSRLLLYIAVKFTYMLHVYMYMCMDTVHVHVHVYGVIQYKYAHSMYSSKTGLVPQLRGISFFSCLHG